MKQQIRGDIPGVLADWLDGLGRKADLRQPRALEDTFLHRVLDLSLMLFRHEHETSSLHPEADVGKLAIINGSLGNRRHQAITFPCLKFVNEKMSSSMLIQPTV
jgi:hypothetical protein